MSLDTDNSDALMNMRRKIPSVCGSVLSYSNLSYSVKCNEGPKKLIDNVSLDIYAGQLLAIMGPSGAGKSTLLDLMSFRKQAMDGASIRLNGKAVTSKYMKTISVFVEQEDAHIGVLTVRETVAYTLRLRYPRLARIEVNRRVQRVLMALGLQSCADQQIGTPISRGISGGQKRRVTAACAMVTYPKILFLDEVTSGLDSTAAREVISAIRNLAVTEGMIVAATIHQPSLETLSHFTNVIFLTEGQVCISTAVDDLWSFFERFGKPVPRFKAPAEHAMDILNKDFTADKNHNNCIIDALREFNFQEVNADNRSSVSVWSDEGRIVHSLGEAGAAETFFKNTLVLSERSMKNYLRNLLAYGVRAGMYLGMGLMLATIWVHLGTSDSTINDRLSVHFFSVAFLAFMSVAGIPEFLEERSVYVRETKNGLYRTLPFVASNTVVNLLFLFPCTVLFSVICYWAVGLHPGALAFWRFVAFLFLAVVAAESQVLIIAAMLPVFIAALAISAFLNGFWMSVGGYFIKARSLPRFWFYSFHFMDYQKYSFELITNSDLRGLTFSCAKTASGCACAYPSSTPDTCTVSGEDVLRYLEIYDISYSKWAGILVGIIVIYRIILYLTLKARAN